MDLDLPDYPDMSKAFDTCGCCPPCDCDGQVIATELGLAIADCEGLEILVTL